MVSGGGGGWGQCPHKFLVPQVPTKKIMLNVNQMDKGKLMPPPPTKKQCPWCPLPLPHWKNRSYVCYWSMQSCHWLKYDIKTFCFTDTFFSPLFKHPEIFMSFIKRHCLTMFSLLKTQTSKVQRFLNGASAMLNNVFKSYFVIERLLISKTYLLEINCILTGGRSYLWNFCSMWLYPRYCILAKRLMTHDIHWEVKWVGGGGGGEAGCSRIDGQGMDSLHRVILFIPQLDWKPDT